MIKQELKTRNEKCKAEGLCFVSLKSIQSTDVVSIVEHSTIQEPVNILAQYNHLPS